MTFTPRIYDYSSGIQTMFAQYWLILHRHLMINLSNSFSERWTFKKKPKS